MLTTLPLETLLGDSTNPRQQAGTCADGFDLGSLNGVYAAYFRTNLYNGDLCFVPSYSTLGVATVTPATAFAKYTNNTTDNPSRPNVIRYNAQENVNNAGTQFNVAHISFTPHNSERIFNEMQNLTPYPPAINECDPSQAAQLTDRQSAVAQKTVHLVVARIRQMRRQMGARVVGGRTQQVLDVRGLGQHERTVLPKLPHSA